MSDLREMHVAEPETSSSRSKFLAAGAVALGLGTLGAYAFASGDMSSSTSMQVATNQIRTTPDYGGQTVPPPVTPAPVKQSPVTPQSSKPQADTSLADASPADKPKAAKKKVEKPKTDDSSQQAVVQPKEPMAPPTPIQTPPENAPQQPTSTPPAEQQQTPPADQPQPQTEPQTQPQ